MMMPHDPECVSELDATMRALPPPPLLAVPDILRMSF